MNAVAKAARVAFMGFDVDGVLTDGTLYYSARGDEMKGFQARDGHGIRMLADAGVQIAIITGRESDIVTQRARNLGISLVLQGIDDKRAAMENLLARLGLGFEQAGYMGDDVVDLPLLRACGFSATVADGHPLLLDRVDHVSPFNGGHGAVREVCEYLLAAQNKLDPALARYLA
ncbi:3-deoxy-D-manno-octulosonate 8-phosphate phosphatase [Georgfuchsia toluolica]|uniref:3-deoxy-D-manno-octulosonate 8-phosphate phosphatase KdsC n=1 Tax=Georgfuchsia toluolica TaxID=424218 RepID=A0A916N2S2_9PROT|nr:HAD hydrolase family protein [Georgfuchsia toluolica]CAG4884229.1 3-deoxy-D-manno-octulosonate 8-phosphate phosphatase [Georgfuchsia toluolica]